MTDGHITNYATRGHVPSATLLRLQRCCLGRSSKDKERDTLCRPGLSMSPTTFASRSPLPLARFLCNLARRRPLRPHFAVSLAGWHALKKQQKKVITPVVLDPARGWTELHRHRRDRRRFVISWRREIYRGLHQRTPTNPYMTAHRLLSDFLSV